jgi:glycosyltransferase involved in cell wall biosynthesis
LLSTRFFGLPPLGYSGIEQVVWDLACSLDGLGHHVTLFAPDGSQATPHGNLVEIGAPHQTCNVDWLKAELESYNFFKDNLDNLDILHDHTHFGIGYFGKIRNCSLPVTHTFHDLDLSFFNLFKPLFKLNLISISEWTTRVFAHQGFNAKHCYNGIDLNNYGFKKEKNDRFMFLGRISRIKAPHLAIKVAKAANVGLDIIGSTKFANDLEYVKEIKALCAGKQIKFIGELNQETKIKYLQNAKGLLITSQFGEPFGLISIEAMACGTPPLALNDGALKEIIENERSGFICNSVEEMMSRLKDVDLILPEICRKRANQFSRKKMAYNYVKIYKSILKGNEW